MFNKFLRSLMVVTGLALPLGVAMVPSVMAADTIQVTVVNNSGLTMKGVYLSPPDQKTWGVNEIEGSPIPDRETADFAWKRGDYSGSDAGCVFDVMAEYSNGKSTELYQVNLCTTPSLNFKK